MRGENLLACAFHMSQEDFTTTTFCSLGGSFLVLISRHDIPNLKEYYIIKLGVADNTNPLVQNDGSFPYTHS